MRSHYLPVKHLLLSSQNDNGNMCRSQFTRGPPQLPQKLYNGNYVILLGKYGNAPMAYNSWVTKGCSDILFKLELELQISIIQENCETPKLEAPKVSPRPLVSSFSP